MATHRKQQERGTFGGWVSNQLWNTTLPWLLAIFFIGAGFYYVTNSTLATHSALLMKQDKEREKMRETFLNDSRSTAAGISELNKQTAVMGTSLLMMQKELEKIANRLDTQPRVR